MKNTDELRREKTIERKFSCEQNANTIAMIEDPYECSRSQIRIGCCVAQRTADVGAKHFGSFYEDMLPILNVMRSVGLVPIGRTSTGKKTICLSLYYEILQIFCIRRRNGIAKQVLFSCKLERHRQNMSLQNAGHLNKILPLF